MLRRARLRGRCTHYVLGLLAAGALLAIGATLWREQEVTPLVAVVMPIHATPRAEARRAANPTPQPEAASDAVAAAAAAAELPLVCAALDEDQHRVPTQPCMDALEARFLPLPASRTILPVSPPLLWSDVFEGMGAKIEAVDAALADEACDVPDGEIKPQFGPRCAARAMAALDVLRQVCSMAGVRAVDPHFPRGFDLRALNLIVWDRVNRTSYQTNVDSAGRTRELERWAERAPDQEAWAAGKRRIDDMYYRTAWKRARCQASAPMLYWMGGERWDGLLARAARLGDAFALAHHLGSAKHAAMLTQLDPLQGHLHLASLELRAVRAAWQKEDSEGSWQVAKEVHEDRIRLLTLAGIDCGDCTVEIVDRAFHYTYDYHFRQCAKVKCANLEAMRELKAILDRPFNERFLTRPARSLPHRKRAEAVAVKYALAVDGLAQAAGVDMDLNLLRHLADPDDPTLLTAEEVEQARSEAAQMIAAI